ncbi:MAG: extracellular solute-binding protein [Chloroflexota bacterium]
MTTTNVAEIAILVSLLAPMATFRQSRRGLRQRVPVRLDGRIAGRMLLLGALLLTMASVPGLVAAPSALAQGQTATATPTAGGKAPTTTTGTTTAATTSKTTTTGKTTAAATNAATGAAAKQTAEPGIVADFGPTDPYYSDVLAGWVSKGYPVATQPVDIPVLKYSDSTGGSYCAAPRTQTGSTGVQLGTAQVCVPASPTTTSLSSTLLESSPEAGNVKYCTADISSASAKQGFCAATVDGQANVLLWNNEDGSLTWKITVPQAGRYNLMVDYYAVPGKDASIGRELLIDGKYPYLEAHRIAFSRTWVNAGPVTQDNQGNDIRPPVKEARSWQSVRANDSLGLTRDPLEFYLTAGDHTVTLNAVREPMALASLKLVPPLEQPTYQRALAQWQAQGLKPVSNVALTIQAEDATARNDPTVRDETSNDPNSVPYSFGHIRLNTYGGSNWDQGGQWVEWTFAVPQDGLYAMTFRVNQGGQGHMNVYRDIQLDDQFQYQELKEFPIGFSLDWENVCVCNAQGQPYLMHLTKGTHILKMTDRVGPIRQTIQDLQSVVQEIGYWQRRIELITGTTPDPNLEYDLPAKMTDLLPSFTAMSNKLDANVKLLSDLNGGHMPDTANSLVTVSDYIKRLVGRPGNISNNVVNFDTYSQQLATWLLGVQQEPVWMDRFYMASPQYNLPPGPSPLWEKIIFTARNFFGSFIFNYTGVGSIYNAQNSNGHPILDIWTARGQQWGLILKDLIETDFTPKSGIYVNLHVFPPGTLGGAQSVLLLALTSGAAPDLATGVDANTPVEFAIRGAIYPLDTFPDYPQVAQQFLPGAIVQFKYPASGPDSHIYALPETQNFQMLFVRTDILAALNQKIPQTWQDIYGMMPVLQQNGMEFYYSTSTDIQTGGFSPFLYQHGGSYYTRDGLRSALDTPQALSAFKQWTELYTNYRVPVQANFYNRFRTGEMPVGVADYNTYISLSVAAPELVGRWKMVPMPGTEQSGVDNRSAGGSGETVVMFQKTQHKAEAWQYMKWWLSAPVQQRYANEIQALLGVSARWNTSNVDALRSLPWPQADIQSILDQWQWFQENPIVLGGYYTPRYLTNAWNSTVLSGANPRDALNDAVRNINTELNRQQIEFNVKVPGQGQQLTEAASGR